MKFKLIYPLLFVAIAYITVGCSKSSTEPVKKEQKKEEKNNQIKVTLTSSSSYNRERNMDDITLFVVSKDSKGAVLDWTIKSVPDVTKFTYNVSDPYAIPLEAFDGGKTFVVESPKEYAQASVNIFGTTHRGSYTLTYKIEKGGKIVKQGQHNITGSSGFEFFEEYQ